MRDLSGPKFQRKKTPVNRVKVQRKPLNLKKYLRPLGKITLGLAGVALVAGLLCAGYRSLTSLTFFRLKKIDVAATKRLSRDEILTTAMLEPGQDLLRLSLNKIGAQVAQNPWVETVRIHRYYPDTISISVIEREPLAVVNMGYLYYLDTKGNIFKPLNQGDRLDYPVITGFSEEDLTRDPNGMKEALKATCDLLAFMREKCSFILADVSEIHYDKGYGFTLFTATVAMPIKLGSTDFPGKFSRLARIYQNLKAQQQSIQYVDLDYNDKIIVKKS